MPASILMLRRLLYLSIEKLGAISNQSVSIPMIAYFLKNSKCFFGENLPKKMAKMSNQIALSTGLSSTIATIFAL